MFNSQLRIKVQHLTDEVSRLNAIIVKMSQDIAELRALSTVKNVPNPVTAQQQLLNNLNNAVNLNNSIASAIAQQQMVGAKTSYAPVTSKKHDKVESTNRNRYSSDNTDNQMASVIIAASDNTVCGGPSSYSSNDSSSHSSHSSHSSYSSHDSGSSYSSDCGSYD